MARKSIVVGDAFTRPADTTAYASGDFVSNSTTAGSCTPVDLKAQAGVGATIRRARLRKSDAGVTNAAFRIHFWAGTTAPTFTNGDNAAFLPAAPSLSYLGACDIAAMVSHTDGATGAGGPVSGQGEDIIFRLEGITSKLYAAVEARGAYTPVSAETFVVMAEVDYDG